MKIEMEYVSQWTLKGFLILGAMKSASISKLSKLLEQCPWSMLHIQDPGMTLAIPPLPGTNTVRMLGVASPPRFLLSSPIQEEGKQNWKQWSHLPTIP